MLNVMQENKASSASYFGSWDHFYVKMSWPMSWAELQAESQAEIPLVVGRLQKWARYFVGISYWNAWEKWLLTISVWNLNIKDETPLFHL